MRMHRVVTALAAALVLATAVGNASAGKLSIESTNFRLVWPVLTLTSGGVVASCPVTLEGTLHSSTFAKIAGLLIGHVTRAISANAVCAAPPVTRFYMLNGTEVINTVTTMNTLPWHLRYQSFSGTLPNITSVNVDIVGASILGEGGGSTCLFRSTAAAPWRGRFEVNGERRITGYRSDESGRIPRFAGGIACPIEAWLAGTAGVTRLGVSNTIRVFLI